MSATAPTKSTPAINDSNRWLLYGANGYTGELIAREAVNRGLNPILAGRSATKIHALAKELGCESRIFTLENQTATLVALQDVNLMLNCAGPFSRTAGPLMQACLASHVHYLDITGEIDVFELAHSLHEKALRAHSVLCSGVGFDVVPTDCIAVCLHAALPDATRLALAFESRSQSSIGTTKTGIESLGLGCRIRRDGKIVEVPFGYRQRTIDLGDGIRDAVTIPWGDISTAYHSTGIPNIEIYLAASPEMIKRMRKLNKWRWLLRQDGVKALLKWQVSRGARGPNQTERDCNPTFVWGEVSNVNGEKKTARIRTANGYVVTVHASLAIVSHLLNTPALAGFFTPAKLMGARFIESLPGSSSLQIAAD